MRWKDEEWDVEMKSWGEMKSGERMKSEMKRWKRSKNVSNQIWCFLIWGWRGHKQPTVLTHRHHSEKVRRSAREATRLKPESTEMNLKYSGLPYGQDDSWLRYSPHKVRGSNPGLDSTIVEVIDCLLLVETEYRRCAFQVGKNRSSGNELIWLVLKSYHSNLMCFCEGGIITTRNRRLQDSSDFSRLSICPRVGGDPSPKTSWDKPHPHPSLRSRCIMGVSGRLAFNWKAFLSVQVWPVDQPTHGHWRQQRR